MSKNLARNIVDDKLISIASKDVASEEVCNDLLTCENKGKVLVEEFIQKRINDKTVDLHSPLPRVKSRTFSSMYKDNPSKDSKSSSSKLLKADRKLLQRLFNAATAGRDVQTIDILKYELAPIPLSLANAAGQMHSTPKSQILNILSSDKKHSNTSKHPRVGYSNVCHNGWTCTHSSNWLATWLQNLWGIFRNFCTVRFETSRCKYQTS